MSGRTDTVHEPLRATWECPTCDRPWPCRVAREVLRREFGANRVALTLHMAGRMAEAMAVLGDRPAVEVWTRFVGWLDLP